MSSAEREPDYSKIHLLQDKNRYQAQEVQLEEKHSQIEAAIRYLVHQRQLDSHRSPGKYQKPSTIENLEVSNYPRVERLTQADAVSPDTSLRSKDQLFEVYCALDTREMRQNRKGMPREGVPFASS